MKFSFSDPRENKMHPLTYLISVITDGGTLYPFIFQTPFRLFSP